MLTNKLLTMRAEIRLLTFFVLFVPKFFLSQNSKVEVMESEITKLLGDLETNLTGIDYNVAFAKIRGKAWSNCSCYMNQGLPYMELSYLTSGGGDKYRFNLLFVNVSTIKTIKNTQWSSSGSSCNDVQFSLTDNIGEHFIITGNYYSSAYRTDKIFLHTTSESNSVNVVSLIKEVITKCKLRTEQLQIEKQKEENAKIELKAKCEQDYLASKLEIENSYNDGIIKTKNGNFSGAVEALELSLSICRKTLAKTIEGDKPLAKHTSEINDIKDNIMKQLNIAKFRNEISILNIKISETPSNASNYIARASYRISLLGKGLSDTKSIDSTLAINDLDKSIFLNPKSDSAYYYRGFFKGVLYNNYKGALQDFDNAIKINTNNKDYYAWRADLRKKIGDTKGAESDGIRYYKIEEKEKK